MEHIYGPNLQFCKTSVNKPVMADFLAMMDIEYYDIIIPNAIIGSPTASAFITFDSPTATEHAIAMFHGLGHPTLAPGAMDAHRGGPPWESSGGVTPP